MEKRCAGFAYVLLYRSRLPVGYEVVSAAVKEAKDGWEKA